LSFSLYNTPDEDDRAVDAVAAIAAGRPSGVRVPPPLVTVQVTTAGQRRREVEGLLHGAADALRRGRVLEVAGVAEQCPAGAGRLAVVSAHHRLGHGHQR
jgi:hypothetical protein